MKTIPKKERAMTEEQKLARFVAGELKRIYQGSFWQATDEIEILISTLDRIHHLKP